MIVIERLSLNHISAILCLVEQLGYPTTEKECAKRIIYFNEQPMYGIVGAFDNNNLVGLIAWSCATC